MTTILAGIGVGYLMKRLGDRKVESIEAVRSRPIEQHDSRPVVVSVSYETGPEGKQLNQVDYCA